MAKKIYVYRNQVRAWANRNGSWLLAALAAVILILILFLIFLPRRDRLDVEETKELVRDVEDTSGEIYRLYLYKGHREAAQEPYKKLYVLNSRIRGEAEHYCYEAQQRPFKKLKGSKRVVVRLAEEYREVIEENPLLPGYEETEEQRRHLDELLETLGSR